MNVSLMSISSLYLYEVTDIKYIIDFLGYSFSFTQKNHKVTNFINRYYKNNDHSAHEEPFLSFLIFLLNDVKLLQC